MQQHSRPVVKIPIIRASSRLQTVCVADVAPQPIHWLWKEKIARGKLTLMSGDPGLGKSLITVALASAVSTGARWPVGDGYAPKGSVILLSDEDAIADTIRPRLDAAGADCKKVHAIEMVEDISQDGEVSVRSFSLAKDVERLSYEVERIGDVVLIQIDPVSAYLGGTDSHKNADIRALLSPLTDLAERFDIAVVIVTHLNKGGGSAIYRSVGSIAFTAAARTAWAVTKDKDDPTRRLMLPVKNNLGNDHTGMAYKIEAAENGAPVVMWDSKPVEINIDEALSSESNDEQWARSETEEWLTELLLGNPIQATDIKKRAAEAGFSWRTVERAKAKCRIKSKKNGMHGKWLWWHPDDIFRKTDEIPEVRHEYREDSPVLERGGVGGLGSEEVTL